MGNHTIYYDSTFELLKPHKINFSRTGGILADKLQVYIDGNPVFKQNVGIFKVPRAYLKKQIHYFVLDELPMEIWWQYNLFADPSYIALVYNGSILAKYGGDKKIDHLILQSKPTDKPEENIKKVKDLKILGEKEKTHEKRIISKEDFPLDNRKGSGILTTEYKIKKTITSQLTIGKNINAQVGLNISDSILKLIKAEISADLSTRIEQEINETITREDNLTFSVQPGDFVIYTIIWQSINRSGEYLIGINKKFVRLNYEVQFGLSYSIESKNLT